MQSPRWSGASVPAFPESKRRRLAALFAYTAEDGRELLERIRRRDTGAVGEFASWMQLHPLGNLTSDSVVPPEKVRQEVLPFAVECAWSRATPSATEDMLRLVRAGLQGMSHARTWANFGVFWPDGQDIWKSWPGLLVRSISERMSHEGCTPTQLDERCLELLHYLGDQHRWAPEIFDEIAAQLDVWKYCLWWGTHLFKSPDNVASSLRWFHQSLWCMCMNGINRPLFSAEYIVTTGAIKALLEHPSCWGMYHEVARGIIRKASEELSSTWTCASALRAGIFECAWSLLGEPALQSTCEWIIAWCYPLEDTASAQLLRKILINETRATEWCASAPQLPGIARYSEDMPGKNELISLFYSDVVNTETSCDTLDVPALLRDVIAFHVGSRGPMPDSLTALQGYLNQKFEDCFRKALEVSASDSSDPEDGEIDRDTMRENSLLHLLMTTCPCFLTFGVKQANFQWLLSQIRAEKEEGDPITLIVPRDSVTEGACGLLGLSGDASSPPPEGLLLINFRGEDGQDAGGLRRAWLELAANQFVKSDLFMSPGEDAVHLADGGPLASQRLLHGRRWLPASVSQCSSVQADWVEQFRLFGSILGLALLHNEPLPITLCPNFLQMVLRRPLPQSMPEMLDQFRGPDGIDETLARKVEQLAAGNYKEIWGVDSLEESLDAACLPKTFVAADSRASELTGSTELKPGGAECSVTEDNKDEYLLLLLRHHLFGSIEKQAQHVRVGLLRVLCPALLRQPSDSDTHLLQLCESSSEKESCQARLIALLRFGLSDLELRKFFTGVVLVDLAAWKACTTHRRDPATRSLVRRFWRAVDSFTPSERSELLAFLRGSAVLPSTGFQDLCFTIRLVDGEPKKLPVAHTCEFSLEMPLYRRSGEMKSKLRHAMAESGFNLA